jgi:hypothetical protein
MGFDLGAAFQGGLGGASTAGALSMNPWAAAAGGVGGFLLGGFQGEPESEEEKLRKALWKQAQEGDPLAREQLRQQTSRMMGMQQAMAAGAPAGQQALAARTAAQTAGSQQMGMAGAAAQADVAARLGAMQALGGMQTAPKPSLLDYILKTGATAGQIRSLLGAGAGASGAGQAQGAGAIGGGGMSDADWAALQSQIGQPMRL